jgi:hypothetical protein
MAHPIGLAPLTVLELAPSDRVSCAVDAGFDCVGLRLLPPTAEEVQHAIVGDTPLVREIARRIADTGMRVLSVQSRQENPRYSVGSSSCGFPKLIRPLPRRINSS